MKKSYIFAGVSILFWSTIATVSKLLLGSLTGMQVLFISSGAAGLALLLVNLCSGTFKNCRHYRLKDYGVMFLIGLPGTFLYYVFLYAGTNMLLASQAFIINYLWPIMSVVFACILLKEKMTLRRGLAIGLSFLGVGVVAGSDLLQFKANTLLDAACCVLCAVSYGLYTALNQKYSYNKSIAVMVAYLSTFLVSGVVLLAQGSGFALQPLQWVGLAYNGVFTMGLATTTWALALEGGKTAKISNLAYLTPFISLIWTFFILKEPIALTSVIGLAIIVLGILLQLKEKKVKELMLWYTAAKR